MDRRGHGLLGPDRFGAHYFQDHLPVREAPSVEGHAVRQLYLLAGVADLYVEDGDESLREAAERLWHEMAATKTYLTGGIGAHHSDEAFGDPYELPNERSYCETCAAIASVMFSWRMLMITGQARYADLMERTLYNGFLGGLSLDGQSYIYANPLQVREGHMAGGNDRDYARKPWFHCACCPPNVMRTLASLEHYVVLSSADEVRVHQYLPGTWTAEVAGGEATISVQTDYPWQGQVRVRVDATPGGTWGLGLRVPHWATTTGATVNGESVPASPEEGWLTVAREWAVGDELVLELPLDVRFTRADPRVDADRGAVALERGPLVYCLEAVDNPGQRLDDVVVDPTVAPTLGEEPALLGGVPTVVVGGRRRGRPSTGWWPYRSDDQADATETALELTAVPYFVWGNRDRGGHARLGAGRVAPSPPTCQNQVDPWVNWVLTTRPGWGSGGQPQAPLVDQGRRGGQPPRLVRQLRQLVPLDPGQVDDDPAERAGGELHLEDVGPLRDQRDLLAERLLEPHGLRRQPQVAEAVPVHEELRVAAVVDGLDVLELGHQVEEVPAVHPHDVMQPPSADEIARNGRRRWR